jgi:hypothetical protein
MLKKYWKNIGKEYVYALLAISILILVSGIITYFRDRNLNKSHQLGKAVITDVVYHRNSGGKAFIQYKFFVMGSPYSIQESIDCPYSDKVVYYLRERQVSIVYRPENPKNSHLLLTFKDFNKYKIKPTVYDSTVIRELYSVCQ